MAATIDVVLTGPIWGISGHREVSQLLDDMCWDVGGRAESTVSLFLDQSIRNPTPYYETQITRERVVPDVVVHDRGIVYGPWLEGTSSRNQTTRFKGYSSFRRATQQTDAEVPSIVDGSVRRWIGRMNG